MFTYQKKAIATAVENLFENKNRTMDLVTIPGHTIRLDKIGKHVVYVTAVIDFEKEVMIFNKHEAYKIDLMIDKMDREKAAKKAARRRADVTTKSDTKAELIGAGIAAALTFAIAKLVK